MIGRTNTGGGSGGGLTFTAVGGTTRPEKATLNMVWVNTDHEITDYVLSSAAPETPVNGMVWTRIENTAKTKVSATVGEEWIVLYVLYTKQYISGAWTDKTAYMYTGGDWIMLESAIIHINNGGVVNTELTGGFYGQIYDAGLYCPYTTLAAGKSVTYTSKKKIDLTDVKTIKARVNSAGTVSGTFFRLGIMNATYNGDSVTNDGHVALKWESGPFNSEERTVLLDVSTLTGEYYIGYSWGVSSSSSSSRSIGGYIYEMWLER